MLHDFSLLQTLAVLPTLYVLWNEVTGVIASYKAVVIISFLLVKNNITGTMCLPERRLADEIISPLLPGFQGKIERFF